MPKIYDQQKRDPSDVQSGGPGQQRTQNRALFLVIAAILAIVIIVMIYRIASGEEASGRLSFQDVQAIASIV